MRDRWCYPLSQHASLIAADAGKNGVLLSAGRKGHVARGHEHAWSAIASLVSCAPSACPATRLAFILKEMAELHPKGFRTVPQRHDRWISLAQLQPANVGAINAHAPGKRGLG